MKSFCLIAFLSIFLSCSKEKDPDLIICTFPGEPLWLETQIKERSSCVCLTELRISVYNNQPVYEFRLIDPLCNGINIVYDQNGNTLFNSSEKEKYENYLKGAQDSKTVWNCKDGAKS